MQLEWLCSNAHCCACSSDWLRVFSTVLRFLVPSCNSFQFSVCDHRNMSVDYHIPQCNSNAHVQIVRRRGSAVGLDGFREIVLNSHEDILCVSAVLRILLLAMPPY